MERNFWLGLVGLALSTVYLYGASFIRSTSFDDPVGAAGLPQILGWLLASVSILLISQAAVARLRHTTAASSEEDTDPTVFDAGTGQAWLRGLGVVAIAVAYIALLPFVGYPVAAAMLIFTMSRYFGMPLTWRVPVVAIVGALVMWGLFGVLFKVRLPLGLLAPLLG